MFSIFFAILFSGISIERMSFIGNEGMVEGVGGRESGIGVWEGVGRARRGGLRRTVTVEGGWDGGLFGSAIWGEN